MSKLVGLDKIKQHLENLDYTKIDLNEIELNMPVWDNEQNIEEETIDESQS